MVLDSWTPGWQPTVRAQLHGDSVRPGQGLKSDCLVVWNLGSMDAALALWGKRRNVFQLEILNVIV